VSRAPEVVSRIEELGGYLALDADGGIRYRVPKDSLEAHALLEAAKAEKQALIAYLRARQTPEPVTGPPTACQTIPARAILLAPRYDGFGRPLTEVPKCWCCMESWQLENVKEWNRQAYAFLKPGCACLDARMCYRCFGCRAHCRCHKQQRNMTR
jgi:hypothetical protein